MKENLNSLRREIDLIDKSILISLEKRLEVSKEVGKYKKQNNLQIRDKKREDEVIKNRTEQSSLSPEFIKKIYGTIFEESRRIQDES
jgi:monofunctional chorismate mutase